MMFDKSGYTFLLLSLMCFFGLSAEEETNDLPSVEIKAAKMTPYNSTGANVESADTSVLKTLQHTSVAEYLSGHTPVFIKENGRGMLSTISLRGTAASHTAVDWNGLPVNSLTMGQTDFNQLPLFFFDQVDLIAGGESANYGNGAIGGSISLSNKLPQKSEGLLMGSAGSYSTYFGGAKYTYVSPLKRLKNRVSLFYNRSANDFHFSLKDYDGEHEYVQKNAAYHNYGLLEELQCVTRSEGIWNFKLWHTNYNRDIQPSVQSNNDANYYEDILDRATRLVADYKRNLYLGRWNCSWKGRGAYLNDHQEYQQDVIATHDFLGDAVFTGTCQNLGFIENWYVKAEVKEQYIRPEVDSYRDDVDEWRTNLSLQTVAAIGKNERMVLHAAVRREFVTDVDVPVTPSIGATFNLLKHRRPLLAIRANYAHNYRVPTLNDRYWGNLDNRYLDPEDGHNVDLGVVLEKDCPKSHNYSLNVTASAFHNDVHDWIMWMPRGNVWKPQNIAHVLAKGIEANVKQTIGNRVHHSLSLAYTYSHTEVLKGFSEMRPFVGRQIALLPEHSFSCNYSASYKDATLGLSGQYVSERSTSDVYDVMDSYFLMSANAGYTFRFKKESLTSIFSVNNLLDTDYQTVPYKAMPHRNYMFTLKLAF